MHCKQLCKMANDRSVRSERQTNVDESVVKSKVKKGKQKCKAECGKAVTVSSYNASIRSFFGGDDQMSVICAETLLTGVIVEHNVVVVFADHFGEWLHQMHLNSDSARNSTSTCSGTVSTCKFIKLLQYSSCNTVQVIVIIGFYLFIFKINKTCINFFGFRIFNRLQIYCNHYYCYYCFS